MSTKCLPIESRRQIILDNILQKSYEDLAELCGCTKQTIYRTVKEWRAEGGFEELLFNEFLRLYPKVADENPEKALDKLVYLMAKHITQKQEIKADVETSVHGDVTVNLNSLTPEQRKQLLKAEELLASNQG